MLAWAAQEQRILLTHDVATMTKHAYERLTAGLPMPGVMEIRQDLPLGGVIDDLALLAACSRVDEWDGQVIYLPL